MEPTYPFDDALRETVRQRLRDFVVQRAAAGAAPRAAGVAITIVGDAAGQACFILTRRQDRLRQHAGQFALPGGRMEAGETPAQAALRELAEEVGLALPESAVLGRLDDFVSRSGHLITPVVVWGGPRPVLRIDPVEVAAAYAVPLAQLDRPGNPHFTRIAESERPVVYLSLLDTVVFAPTAALLYQFSEVALHARQTRVADLEQPVFAWQ